METKTYNGWTNYETWNVKLWQDNDQGSHEYWNETARAMYEESEPDTICTKSERARYDLAERIKEEVNEASPLAEGASMYHDLLSAALSDVDWDEIAEAWLEDNVEEYEPRN